MWIGFKIYIGTVIHGSTVVLIRVRIYTLIDPGPDRVPNLVLCDLVQDRLVRVCSVADPGPDRFWIHSVGDPVPDRVPVQ